MTCIKTTNVNNRNRALSSTNIYIYILVEGRVDKEGSLLKYDGFLIPF